MQTLVVLLVALPLLAVGQETISYSLLDLQVMAGLGDGFMATWRVPQGMSDFTYFRMYFTFFNSNNYRRSITIYPSDNRLNRTGDMFSFAFAGLHSLSSYEDYYSDVYGRGNGSFLITVVGNDDTGYWFSNDVMFTPAKSSAPFELLVFWMTNDFSVYYAKNLAEELTLVVRSTSPEFVRSRGTIVTYQLTGFEGYSVFRGVINTWGMSAILYRDNLQQWLNEDKVNDTMVGGEGKLLYFYSYNSIPVLLAEGSCGFVISSVDDPYCPANVSMSTDMSTPVTMSPDTTMPTNATASPTFSGVDQTVAPVSSGSNAIPVIALAISCIAIIISLLVVVGLAMYIAILRRKYQEEVNERKPRPFSEMTFLESPTGVAVVESPLYGRDTDFLVDNEQEQGEEDVETNFQKVSENDEALY